VTTGEDVEFALEYDCGAEEYDFFLIGIHSTIGERLLTVSTNQSSDVEGRFTKAGRLFCKIPKLNLAQGEYYLVLVAGRNRPRQNFDVIDKAMVFEVQFGDYFHTGEQLLSGQGSFAFHANWTREGGI
jgi:hypothetical protein